MTENSKAQRQTAVIIGAGPAGLTAAFDLLSRTNIQPIILEASDQVGGISRTVQFSGNRLDIGGHRFFTRSERVLRFWQHFLPFEDHNSPAAATASSPEKVMLVRKRKSRIYVNRHFYHYPVSLNLYSLRNFGIKKAVLCLLSYLKAKLWPFRSENSLEEFYVNRFGKMFYFNFFKNYTEKILGIDCSELSPKWGEERIENLSLMRVISFHFRKMFERSGSEVEKSLIDRFLYPKYGAGQIWDEVAEAIRQKGGKILLDQRVKKINLQHDRLISVETISADGATQLYTGDFYFSSIPLQEFVSIANAVPVAARKVAQSLEYRNFIIVGLLVDRLCPTLAAAHMSRGKRSRRDAGSTESSGSSSVRPDDTWIYIHDKEVRMGRLQFFNNWSPYLVADPDTLLLGAEYFCSPHDELWQLPDDALQNMAAGELKSLGFIDDESNVIRSTVIRMPKAYPLYTGSYRAFGVVQQYLNSITNFFPIGRNGMHRYNNVDHSMLSAMHSIDGLVEGKKIPVWEL